MFGSDGLIVGVDRTGLIVTSLFMLLVIAVPVTTISPKNITVVNASASAPTQLCNDSSGTYAYMTNAGSNNVVIINTGTAITNSINSEVILQA